MRATTKYFIRAAAAGAAFLVSCNFSVGPVPSTYQLKQNYPNPFQDTTVVEYGVPNAGTVSYLSLIVYDVHKAKVRTLVDAYFHPAGTFQVVWNGKDDNFQTVPPNLYVVELAAPNSNSVAGRITVLKR